jgi:hypothetical protein
MNKSRYVAGMLLIVVFSLAGCRQQSDPTEMMRLYDTRTPEIRYIKNNYDYKAADAAAIAFYAHHGDTTVAYVLSEDLKMVLYKLWSYPSLYDDVLFEPREKIIDGNVFRFERWIGPDDECRVVVEYRYFTYEFE